MISRTRSEIACEMGWHSLNIAGTGADAKDKPDNHFHKKSRRKSQRAMKRLQARLDKLDGNQ